MNNQYTKKELTEVTTLTEQLIAILKDSVGGVGSEFIFLPASKLFPAVYTRGICTLVYYIISGKEFFIVNNQTYIHYLYLFAVDLKLIKETIGKTDYWFPLGDLESRLNLLKQYLKYLNSTATDYGE